MSPKDHIRYRLAVPEFFAAAKAAKYTDRTATILFAWVEAYTPSPDENGRLRSPSLAAQELCASADYNIVNAHCDAFDLEAFERLLWDIRDLIGRPLTDSDYRIAWGMFLNNPLVLAKDVVAKLSPVAGLGL